MAQVAEDDGLGSIAHPTVLSPNLLESYGKGQDIAGKVWENRLSQAKQASGQAFLDSVGPGGTTDQNRLLLNLKNAGPAAALAAQPSAEAGQRLSTEEYGQRMKRLTAGAAGFGQILVDNNGTAPYEAVKQYYDRAVKDGHVTQADEDKVMSGFGPDPVANASVGRQRMMQSIQTQEALSRANGTPGTISDGQNTYGTITHSQSGALTLAPGQGIPTGFPSRDKLLEQLNQPADAKTAAELGVPVGTPLSLPLLQRLQQQGAGPDLLGPAGAPARGRGGSARPDPWAGQPNPLLGGLPNPTEATPAPAPAPAVAPQTAAPAPGGLRPVVSGPAPGTEKNAELSVGAFKDVSDQGTAAQSRGAVLDNMLSDTSQFTTGPGADAIARVRAVANRLGFKIDTEGLSAAESFKKLAAALNANQGSDARLSVSEASNPHADLSPAGVDLMLRQLRGNEDYNIARAKLAATYPDRTDKIGFEAKLGSQLDPRTFQYDRMTPDQKARFFKSIDDKAKFVKAHDAAASLLGGGR